ncbi:MAG TPA: TIGR03087 family PEP-CTERM/XrtA system glycosyltransferase [Pirellulales bacterium]|nr:TIGR03087 family PEP-CTERM/XrtA system glycosyltransferase [Pirellulales bacterium]
MVGWRATVTHGDGVRPSSVPSPSVRGQHRGLNNLPNSGKVAANPPHYWGSERVCVGKLFNPRCSVKSRFKQIGFHQIPDVISCSTCLTPPHLNLLYLVHRIPYPPNRGDRIRSYHLLRFLAARYDVYLACLADEPVPPAHEAALREFCRRLAIVPLGRKTRWLNAAAKRILGRSATEGLFESPALRRIVSDWAGQTRFDVVFAFCSSMVPYLELPALRDVPALIDFVDVDSQKWFDYAETATGLKRALFASEGRRVRRLEIDAARRARAVAVVSEAEAELCREHCAPTPVYGIGNGVDLDYFGAVSPPEDSADQPHCVFVGALDYRANVDGITWFCREVWPEMRRRYPQATFTAVGRNPSAVVCRLADLPGVQVVADVPDVRPYLARASAVVAPLRVARGIQNKVLEALAARRAVVASSGALDGLDVEAGRHALCADLPSEWITALSRLFDDAALRNEFGASGRAFVELHHGWAPRLAPFGDLLSNLITQRRAVAASCQ